MKSRFLSSATFARTRTWTVIPSSILPALRQNSPTHQVEVEPTNEAGYRLLQGKTPFFSNAQFTNP
jgi:hypothetical protein